MMTIIKVLMIDDDEAYHKSLVNEAAVRYHINLLYDQYLDTGLKQLETNRNIEAVILDGKGLLKAGQEKEDFDHVHEGLLGLKLIEEKQDRYIPKFVLTALSENLQGHIKKEPIYDKKRLSDEEYKEHFFAEIRAKVEGTEDFHIRTKYREVLEAAKLHLPDEKEDMLYEIFKHLSFDRCGKKEFADVRMYMEAIFKQANSIHEDFLPKSLLLPDGGANLADCINYWSGNEIRDQNGNILFQKQNRRIAPKLMEYTLRFIKNSTSGFVHGYKYGWTKYAYAASVNALCELILWFKRYIEEKYAHGSGN